MCFFLFKFVYVSLCDNHKRRSNERISTEIMLNFTELHIQARDTQRASCIEANGALTMLPTEAVTRLAP